jgi:4-hydroxy-tetrahydrodipicolinate reductase
LSDNQTNNEQSLAITSKRIDPAPGTHIIRYQSEIDTIEISHTAHSREGFALGAILVAEWIQGKKGVLSMDDFLSF